MAGYEVSQLGQPVTPFIDPEVIDRRLLGLDDPAVDPAAQVAAQQPYVVYGGPNNEVPYISRQSFGLLAKQAHLDRSRAVANFRILTERVYLDQRGVMPQIGPIGTPIAPLPLEFAVQPSPEKHWVPNSYDCLSIPSLQEAVTQVTTAVDLLRSRYPGGGLKQDQAVVRSLVGKEFSLRALEVCRTIAELVLPDPGPESS